MEKEENFECQQNHEENSKTKGALQSWEKIKVLILVLSLERRHHRPVG